MQEPPREGDATGRVNVDKLGSPRLSRGDGVPSLPVLRDTGMPTFQEVKNRESGALPPSVLERRRGAWVFFCRYEGAQCRRMGAGAGAHQKDRGRSQGPCRSEQQLEAVNGLLQATGRAAWLVAAGGDAFIAPGGGAHAKPAGRPPLRTAPALCVCALGLRRTHCGICPLPPPCVCTAGARSPTPARAPPLPPRSRLHDPLAAATRALPVRSPRRSRRGRARRSSHHGVEARTYHLRKWRKRRFAYFPALPFLSSPSFENSPGCQIRSNGLLGWGQKEAPHVEPDTDSCTL